MFNNQEHLDSFKSLCPGKLITDSEWYSTIFILTSDSELRSKTLKHVNQKRREIKWNKIFDTDFSSGHRAALYWSFSLWSGNSWSNEEGEQIDTMDKSYYMDERLRRTAIKALELRWGIKYFEEDNA